MANPMLNDKTFEAAQAGWAAPKAPSPGGHTWPAPGATAPAPPMTDGPVSPWSGGVMTIGGTISATAVLFALLLVAAAAGWASTGVAPDGAVEFPALAMVGVFVGIGCIFALWRKPMWAKYVGPVYALAQGFAVGAISHAYESFKDGIVVQAAGATIAVFAVMLVLYRTGIIRVTNKFRKVVVSATIGIMVFYGVSLVMNLFGAGVPFLREPSLLGIGFSVLVSVLAALNLALDFDFIDRGTKAGLAKDFEWYAAFGLLVTVVWLYLELLRLLAKLNQR